MPHDYPETGSAASPELLAPAGSPEALAAAVAAGADAVYLAGRRFGARHYAANFSDDELRSAVGYAHLRGVRVYVTVNTLVSDAELPDVVRYLLWLYETGVDAVLVQDTGVAALAREVVPDLPLHASTQMTIHNREGVARAAREGFSRVVPARELTLPEIEDIAEVPGIGIEVFAHGALCYCYSGQCLLSSVIGGRSGNRGMCAQPCRKPYRLVTAEKDEYGRPRNLRAVPAEGQYLLSTRDLAVYPSLDRIARAPVASLKIEGRMRSAEYVATVVAIYRRALDAIAAGEAWSPSGEDMRDLALAFNRKFTEGYILGASDIMARDRPGNRGILLGTVVGYDPGRREATVRLTGEVVPRSGDGLAFCTEDPERDVGAVVRGTPAVRRGMVRVGVPAPVGRDTEVFLTKSADLEARATKIAEHLEPLPIDVTVTWDDGTPCFEGVLPGRGGEPLRVLYRADLQMEPARSRPLAPEEIAEQFTRTGGTPFVIRRLDLRYPGGLFTPLSALNRVRRTFLEKVEEAVAAAHRPGPDAVRAARERAEAAISGLVRTGGVANRLPSVSVYTDTLEGVEAAVRGGARTVYFEPAGPVVPALLEEAAALCRAGGADAVWKWPSITRRAFLDAAAPLLPSLYDAGVHGVMVSGLGAADAVREAEPRMRLFGAAGLNVWNHCTTRVLAPLFLRCTASPELPAGDLARLAELTGDAPGLEVLVQGNIEAMVTEDRLAAVSGDRFLGLQDRRNHVFPLRCDSESRVYIANAVETCLIDHLPRIIGMGIDAVAIDARGRGPRYAGEMARLYLAGIESVGRGDPGMLDVLKDEVKQRALGGITGGHFVRGLTG
ncbi:putative protease [Methanoculleus bourgensis MS2]|uniref:Protease n=1 Tax=Methanoculleus bourgensis (strain ATCC 43281 / DSM 3045 / OCM 15 / MS2) TaxID=1201294 RepID=I7KDK9_METBM|nr:U32 family peptidase [Methanoculleus bourgensis]CCJ36971.1 putative protease [Methanoculleus bourgensis MS2]